MQVLLQTVKLLFIQTFGSINTTKLQIVIILLLVNEINILKDVQGVTKDEINQLGLITTSVFKSK